MEEWSCRSTVLDIGAKYRREFSFKLQQLNAWGNSLELVHGYSLQSIKFIEFSSFIL
jgi:hypothetical protein